MGGQEDEADRQPGPEAEAARRAAAVTPVDEVGAAIKAGLRARTLAVTREAACAGIAPPGLRDALMRHPSRGAMEQALAEWHEPVWADGLVARPADHRAAKGAA